MSPLELFHPEGVVKAVLREGGARHDVLLAGASDYDQVGLILLAPTREQWRSENWLDSALGGAVPRLATDGIVYLFAPFLGRRRARRVLELHGLRARLAIAHVPSFSSSRYLVPIHRRVAHWAFASVITRWPRRRRALAALLRLPGGTALLARLLPSVALVAQRPGSRPVFEWIARLAPEPSERSPAVIVTSGCEGDDRFVVLSLASDSPKSLLVGKVRPGEGRELEEEAANLAKLGPPARAAGARIPELRLVQPFAGGSVLVESGLPGDSAAAYLASRPRAVARVLTLLVDWLEAWQSATVVRRAATAGELEQHVLAPAGLVTRRFEGGASYLSWLKDRCRDVEASPMPFVAAHNDLTMFNVLVEKGGLGVVDWEAASEHQFPLSDFVYAAADAAAAVTRYEDRVAALEQCFSPLGRFATLVASLQHRIVAATGTSAEVEQLSFHACWLHHAANEDRSADARSDRPFLAIVKRLASDPRAWPSRRR